MSIRKLVESNISKIISSINRVKDNYLYFSCKQLITLLSDEKCPYAKRIPSILNKMKIIDKSPNGKYHFTYLPLFEFELMEHLISHVEALHKSNKKYKKKTHYVRVQKDREILNESSAIKFLKGLGYVIYKPI